MFTLRKEFHLCCSHQLAGLPPDHPCSRLHGHNYVVEVELQGTTPDSVGFIVDYREMDTFKRWLDETFDHRHLNDILELNPTAEYFALYLYDVLREQYPSWPVAAVAVRETPKTFAEYRP